MKGNQAITSQQLVIAHICFDITDGRQTGNQALATEDCSHFISHQRWKTNRQSGVSNFWLFTFHFTSEMEGKQEITSQQLVIAHICFDITDGWQTGNQALAT
jgi:hypothetical protein